jgi:hypothetical protein
VDAALERVRELQSLTDVRLRWVRDALERSQQELTLLQTSMLGALLAALAAIHAVEPALKDTLPEAVKWTSIIAVAAVAFALPLLVTHRGGFRRIDRVAAAAGTAAVALFGASLLWWWQRTLLGSYWWSLLVMPPAALLGWFLAWFASHRRRLQPLSRSAVAFWRRRSRVKSAPQASD